MVSIKQRKHARCNMVEKARYGEVRPDVSIKQRKHARCNKKLLKKPLKKLKEGLN